MTDEHRILLPCSQDEFGAQFAALLGRECVQLRLGPTRCIAAEGLEVEQDPNMQQL